MTELLIDSHVNLHHEKFDGDVEEVIARAREAGVFAMLTISDRISSTEKIRAIADRHPAIWRSVGAHPHYAEDHPDLTSRTLIDLSTDRKVIGIGECGLDFHYGYSPAPDQERVFAAHIEASQETGLPLIIHTREADDLTARMLTRAMAKERFVPLLHCYTSGLKLAEAVMEMGGYISFSGIITFRNAVEVCAVAAKMPHARIIVETDCPYLAPAPFRGRRCEPAHIIEVATKLSEILGLSLAEVKRLTTENFFRLFTRAAVEDVSS